MDFNWHTLLNPMHFAYGILAIFGGVARYLRSYTDGVPFNFGVFVASSVVSGFSGYMFAMLGVSLMLPQPLLFVMAGMGGFFGDQTMKLIYEYVAGRVK